MEFCTTPAEAVDGADVCGHRIWKRLKWEGEPKLAQVGRNSMETNGKSWSFHVFSPLPAWGSIQDSMRDLEIVCQNPGFHRESIIYIYNVHR